MCAGESFEVDGEDADEGFVGLKGSGGETKHGVWTGDGSIGFDVCADIKFVHVYVVEAEVAFGVGRQPMSVDQRVKVPTLISDCGAYDMRGVRSIPEAGENGAWEPIGAYGRANELEVLASGNL